MDADLSERSNKSSFTSGPLQAVMSVASCGPSTVSKSNCALSTEKQFFSRPRTKMEIKGRPGSMMATTPPGRSTGEATRATIVSAASGS